MSTGGVLGGWSARAFLAMLETAEASGTLYLGYQESGTLIVLRRGTTYAHTDLGAAFDLGASGAQFGFWPHAEQALPTLPSRYPGSQGLLWALPALCEQPLLSTAETDLRGLVARLLNDTFGGALVLENAATQGLLLFQGGQLGGAVCEEGLRYRSGGAALRALLHLAEPAALTLHPLPKLVTASLLGWLQGPEADSASGPPENFTGLELTPGGARYYRAGTAYLQLPHPAGTRSPGWFPLCTRVASLPLPTEPPGWEERRYGLTLRGRDALNPMTELSMRFRGEFGRIGQRALEGFRRDASLEGAAETLNLDPGDLQRTVERLEAEGFIRAIGEPSPTPHLYTR